MATRNKLQQQMTDQSVSWGSLMLLVCGLGIIIFMMVMYSQQALP
ncbi:hypothetical protein [Gloeocapsopsis dulcis]|nr:hypothetical protein [Gloeocapsopsis dulcis]WNN91213.1 hypothetical protein P0S91_09125 [Gloeocapsopsis dulcis]